MEKFPEWTDWQDLTSSERDTKIKNANRSWDEFIQTSERPHKIPKFN